MGSANHARLRRLSRIAAVAVGGSALIAVAPIRAATPSSANVGISGSGFPASVSWTGASLAGNPDPLGPPAPSCNSGCDRFAFTLEPNGITKSIVVSVTATIKDTDSQTSFDTAILNSHNNVLAQSVGATDAASVAAADLSPGTYVVEVDGDIGDPADTGYAGGLLVTTAARTIQAVHPVGHISGSRETVADPYRLGTEPTVAISPDGTVYEGPIFGFASTQSFVERSSNGGQTFNTLGVPGGGKVTTCPGGGDEDISTDQHNNLYFFDLGGAPLVPAAVSPDHGNTFIDNCVANDTASDPNRPNVFPDRQWLSTDIKNQREWYIWRDGLVSASTPTDPVAGPLYGEFIEYAALPSGAAGPSQLVFTHLCHNSSGQGLPCLSDLSVAGNAVTDNSPASPHYGTTYLAIARGAGVSVVVINPNSATPVLEQTAAPGASNVLFPTVAVDRAGNVYETYTDANTFQLMFTWSSDGGTTWTKPIVINGAPAAVTVMPWIVAGDNGRVDIAFYGSPKTAAPSNNYGPWNVYMVQSLHANDATPRFGDWSEALMTDRPNHIEPVCLSGLGCTTNTGPGGDRELGDFFRVALDRSGRAVISFADGNNQLGQEVAGGPAAAPSFADLVRQATGPSLYQSVGNVPSIPLPTNGVTVGAHADPIPFASAACDPPAGPCPSVDALNLLSSSAYISGGSVHVHLVVKNLDALAAVKAPALATSTFLTRWWFNGQLYYAAAEDNAGQFRGFAGQVAPVSDGLAVKYAYYPATHALSAAQVKVVSGKSGTIDLTVPVGDVGKPAASTGLHSVTSYTNTHASPTAPVPPTASNFTDLPQIVDVLPAYNVIPTKPAAPSTTSSASPLLALGVVPLGWGLWPRRRVKAMVANGRAARSDPSLG